MQCMATGNLSVRLTESERRALDHAARQHDVGPSTWAKFIIRQHLGMGQGATSGVAETTPDYGGQIEELDRRLVRVEEIAGL